MDGGETMKNASKCKWKQTGASYECFSGPMGARDFHFECSVHNELGVVHFKRDGSGKIQNILVMPKLTPKEMDEAMAELGEFLKTGVLP